MSQCVKHVCKRFVKYHTCETGCTIGTKERCRRKCCAVEGYGEISLTSTTNNIRREHLDLVETADTDSSPLALCNPHYEQLYKAF